jgi:hypothetical protein
LTTTTKLTSEGVDVFIESINRDYDESKYYVFTSKYTEWPGGDVAPTLANTSVRFQQEARNEMMSLKKVLPLGVRRMIRRKDWTSGTVYDAYDDVANLEELDFFVVNTNREVYKCLDNAGGAPSTVVPAFTSNSAFTSADGYVWKYMFSVSEDAMDLHSTANSMPIEESLDVVESAVDGSIEVVRVIDSANAWPSQETTSVLAAVSNNTFRVDALDQVDPDYYVNFGLYVTSGGGAGFLSKISSYTANGSGYFVSTEQSNTLVTTGSAALISPLVTITGDGSGAKAYCTVNNAAHQVHSVVMIERGVDYKWASATVTCNSMHQSTATVRPITSPPGGHGRHPHVELQSDSIKFAVKFDPSDGILTKYRKIGMIKNPKTPAGADVTAALAAAYHTANVTLLPGVTYPPTPGETIVGYNTGARATVITSNTTYVTFADVSGTFANGEIVLGSTSSSLVSLDAINTPTANCNSGTIIFLDALSAVQRQSNASETVYVEIKL